MINIKIFAYLREELGEAVSLELTEPITKKSVLKALIKDYPKLQESFEECAVAVNQVFLKDEDTFFLQEVKEVALIPPVSGG